jgi:hypothetical protein
MGMTMRVSLPGYDCLTDGTVDHYALYSDEDNVLIKEYVRGTATIGSASIGTVNHNFGYPPFFMGYVGITVGTVTYYQWLYGSNFFSYYSMYADTANAYLKNDFNETRTFKYYVFYDNQT